MDNFVRDPTDRLDRWFYYVSRGERTNSLIAGFRADLAHLAFRLGTTHGLKCCAPRRMTHESSI